MLKNRNFSLIFWGQWVSNIGSSINYIGITWLTMQLNGKVAQLSILLMLLKLPSIIIGPLSGVWVDRWNKKNIIVVADFIRGILSIALILTKRIELIYFIVLTQAVFDVFFNPAISSIIPGIVKKEELVVANSMSASTRQISKLIGPAIGGVLIGMFGVNIIFIINGISFIISGLSELFIKFTPKKYIKQGEDRSSFKEDLISGFNYIRSKQIIKFVIIFFAIASIGFGAFPVLNVAYINKELKLPAQIYGFLMTLFSVGALLGSFIIGNFERKLSEIKMIVMGLGAYGVSFVLFSVTRFLPLMAFFFTICGVVASMINISYGVYLQKYVEPDKLGRVFSIDMAIGNLIVLFAMGIVGITADFIGSHTMILICGILMILQSFITLNLKVYKNLTRSGKEVKFDY